MRKKSDYHMTIGLDNDQVAAKVNIGTGEVTVVDRGNGKLPDGYEMVEMNKFSRHLPEVWNYLKKHLTNLEWVAATKMGYMACAYTNSLRHLNDQTTLMELSQAMDISVNRVSNVVKKLFELGVFAKFDVVEVDCEYKKYWIFNPYLSFNGRVIETSMKNLFKNTLPAKVYRGDIS